MTARSTWLVLGHGSVGSALVRRLDRAGMDPVVYDPSPRVAVVAREHLGSLVGVARTFDRVISCVAPTAASAALEDARPVLHPGTLYMDWNTVAPDVKRSLATAAPCPVIDVALLDTLDEESTSPSIAISGSHAGDALADLGGLGFHVDVVGEAAGDAALLKYARSLFMKTLEALIVEFEAAIATLPGRDVVTASIERNLGPTFMDFARMLIETDRIHAGRRADELAGAVRAHADAGLAVPLAAAAVEVLRDAARAWQEADAPPSGAGAPALAAYLASHLGDRRLATVGEGSDAGR
jgi:3-hydroxyisobutyrate dehydrogenase-like beta-hydroxyacid dehydrogenase